MKHILKGVVTKILSIIVIIGLIVCGGYVAYKHLKAKVGIEIKHETSSDVEIIKEKLENIAELNTGSYLCTDVITKDDSKKIKGWEIPFTEKSFIVQYDGIVKAGIKDLTKAQVSEKGGTIIVQLPEVEITGIEIDNDSFEKLDESNNIFNPITLDDMNKAQKDLKEKMYQRALEKGILDIAKSNAEEVLEGMLSGANDDYDIKFEWQ